MREIVETWKFRYESKWATDEQIDTLVSLGAITEEEAKFIKKR